jgi:hypothetical protein
MRGDYLYGSVGARRVNDGLARARQQQKRESDFYKPPSRHLDTPHGSILLVREVSSNGLL